MSTPQDTPSVVARVGIHVRPDMTMLDVLGPHQALVLCPGLDVFTFARTTDPLVPDHGFADVPDCDSTATGSPAAGSPLGSTSPSP